MLPQDTTYLIQRPCYQRGSLCQDPANSRTKRRPPDHRKETQTEVVWTCLPFFRFAKIILQGTVKEWRRQGRQRKRWEDNIGECAGLKFAQSQWAVENGAKWRKLVVRSSVVPQRPSRSRDRWGWRLVGQPQRITSGLNTNFTLCPSYSLYKSSYHKSCFYSLFTFRRHSTR